VLSAGVPVLLSESVYWQLVDRGEIPAGPEEKLCFPVTLPCTLHLGDHIDLRLVPGAHTPGATMVRITTAREQVLYPGDYCLRNAYYKRHPSDLLGHFAEPAKRGLLLVDGTFLGYQLQGHALSTLKDLTQELRALHKAEKSVVFLAQSADYLYTIYIWLFRNFYAHGNLKGSSPEDVVRIVTAAAEKQVQPIIFHNSEKRVRLALQARGVEDKLYQCLKAPQ
jgi:hypothetical protein